MNRIILGIVAVLVATSPGAQDSKLTDEQLAAKCANEGGCAVFSRDDIVRLMQIGYKKGLRDCNSNV